jgi:hypothetical protein
MAAPETVSILIPAYNERPSIAQVIADLRAAAPWREIIVVDDGSTDETGKAAADAGARVVRHPYNKGNGAAVKSGIRAATGDYILIIDGDGQHKPSDALALICATRRITTWWSAPARRRRRLGRAAGWATPAQPAGQLPDGARDSRSHVRLPRGSPRVPGRVPAPAAQRFLDPDHDDAVVPARRLQRDVPRHRGAAARGRFEDPSGPRRPEVSVDHAARDDHLQSAAACSSHRGRVVFSSASRTASGTSSRTTTFPTGRVLLLMLSVVVLLIGLVSEQISALRFDGRK